MDVGGSNNMSTPQWRNMSGAELADAYSPSTALEGNDLATFIQQYKSASKSAYASLRDVQTISYGPKPSNTIDVVTPGATPPVPIHVFIHGGYWQELSKRESFFPAIDTLSRGFAFAAVDYTLAPEASIDEIVEECCAALICIAEQARTLGIDRERIIVSGSSAGAHLAAMCCLRLPRQIRLKAVALISGIYELEPLVRTYINDAVGMDLECAKRNSPALADLGSFPPAIIAWGESETEEFKRQSRHFADLLTASSASVDTLEVRHRNHFDVVFDIANQSELGQLFFKLAS